MSFHEGYVSPVGFAREPADERRRWIGRLLFFAVVAGLVWLAYFRVFSTPDDTGGPIPVESQLPGPV